MPYLCNNLADDSQQEDSSGTYTAIFLLSARILATGADSRPSKSKIKIPVMFALIPF